MWATHNDFLSKKYSMKRWGKRKLYSGETRQKRLSRLIKVNIKHESCWCYEPLTGCDGKGTLPLWSSFPKPITPVSPWAKLQTDPNRETVYKTVSRTRQKVIRNKESLRNHHSQEKPKETFYLTIKRNVVSRTGSCHGKKGIMWTKCGC